MPILEQAGCDRIATGVEETHEAASLIDLDLKLSEGSFFAPARVVRLGEVWRNSAGGFSTA
jgi:EAL domain-containing protein (putative c-di-GMP-specific phosphodiesterase class I)